MTAIREITRVKQNGALLVRHLALTEGQAVEVIVLAGAELGESPPA
jgi:hypothetical protein